MADSQSLAEKGAEVVQGAQRRLDRLRERFGWLDHIIKAGALFGEVTAGRLAAACTYYGFLAIFPLLLLAFSVLGYVFAGHPEITQQVETTLHQNLPFISVQDIVKARGAAGDHWPGRVFLSRAWAGWTPLGPRSGRSGSARRRRGISLSAS
ncbi:YhjD/YihY/BrkB family envelope integrity protein [Fodinicola feengrottensis]|uniref:YhjD/YihY/BrkB family envelope integrity protein n=1 Tax=Fodinicola feengrottensis TaxID=435914 RepID=UPI0013CFDAC3|nr:YhjD/YihY/BrkB family envelope integrity protein [Fodinicola feengrottensis]